MNAWTELRAWLGGRERKALTRDKVQFPGRAYMLFDQARQPIEEIAREVGDGTTSDVLMSTLRWLQRSAVEAPLVVQDAEGSPLPDSELQGLLNRPNPFYGLDTLVAGSIYDLSVEGDSYWLPTENGNGAIRELWYLPAGNVEPKWPDSPTDEERESGADFISHYEYSVVGGETMKLLPDEVIHFRHGVDPRNIRKGLSPLRGLLREIWTDSEAAAFTAALLRRGAVPGLIISPASNGPDEATLGEGEINAARSMLDSMFTREGRGRVLGFSGAVKVEQFGFNPQQLDLSALRNVAEERIPAAFGVASAVIGFGAGLETAKVGASMKELRQDSYRNGVVPLWRILERTLSRTLVPMMQNGAASVAFDRNQVKALREDQDSLSRRIVAEVGAGLRTRGEGRTALGLESSARDDVYLLPLSTLEVPSQRVIDVTPEQRRLIEAHIVKHTPSGLEADVIAEAPRRQPPRAVQTYVRRMETAQVSVMAEMETALTQAFVRLGRAAEREARELLREELSGGEAEHKQDERLFDDTLAALADALTVASADLRSAFDGAYRAMGAEAEAALAAGLGIEFRLPEPAQLNILREGGLRLGLVDLEEQTREALFDALAEAREEGLAGDNLARRIRDRIEAGPWRDVATRARVIARTEGAHAANTASLEAARSMDETEHVMVLDDRIGFGDETCAGINGTVVTIQQAEAMGLAHPNCTRSFTPVNALLMEELGL